MKKIIHKLKKNRLVSKIAALLTICMILVSSFSVSSFAADEEYVIKAGSYHSVDRQAVWLPDETLVINGDLIIFDFSFTGLQFTLDDILILPVNYSLFDDWTEGTFVMEVQEDISVNFLQYTVFTKNFIYQGSRTESITDVCTSITGSIVSLLGSAQGLFYSDDIVPLVYGDVPDHSSVKTVSLPVLSNGDTLFVLINVNGESVLMEAYVSDSAVGGTAELYLYLDNGENDLLIAQYNDRLYSTVSGWTTEYFFVDVIVGYSFGGSLSFLGTLAVLGLAIGLILLLVYVIVNFLRLRG